jgi:hypothetical protein
MESGAILIYRCAIGKEEQRADTIFPREIEVRNRSNAATEIKAEQNPEPPTG